LSGVCAPVRYVLEGIAHGARHVVGSDMENRKIPAKTNRDDARDKAEGDIDAEEAAPPPDDDDEWWMPLEADLTGPEAAFHRRPGDEHPPRD
jgi:hypothetical protein